MCKKFIVGFMRLGVVLSHATGGGPIPPCSAHVLRVSFLQASKFYPARRANLIEKMVSIRDIISYSFCFTCISIHPLIHPFAWLLVITHPSISSYSHLSNHHTVHLKSFPKPWGQLCSCCISYAHSSRFVQLN